MPKNPKCLSSVIHGHMKTVYYRTDGQFVKVDIHGMYHCPQCQQIYLVQGDIENGNYKMIPHMLDDPEETTMQKIGKAFKQYEDPEFIKKIKKEN